MNLDGPECQQQPCLCSIIPAVTSSGDPDIGLIAGSRRWRWRGRASAGGLWDASQQQQQYIWLSPLIYHTQHPNSLRIVTKTQNTGHLSLREEGNISSFTFFIWEGFGVITVWPISQFFVSVLALLIYKADAWCFYLMLSGFMFSQLNNVYLLS